MHGADVSRGKIDWRPRIPSWDKQAGCALEIETPVTDFANAEKRCDELLDPQFDAPRTGEKAQPSDLEVRGMRKSAFRVVNLSICSARSRSYCSITA
jgi:hypothetical protein